jgi:hypothetical protein
VGSAPCLNAQGCVCTRRGRVDNPPQATSLPHLRPSQHKTPAPPLPLEAVPGTAHGVGERIPRQGADNGIDRPPEGGREVAAQGNGLAFHVSAAVALLETPVGVQAPKAAMARAGRNISPRCTSGAQPIWNRGNSTAAHAMLSRPVSSTLRWVSARRRVVPLEEYLSGLALPRRRRMRGLRQSRYRKSRAKRLACRERSRFPWLSGS